jgi:hypothetical protein
MSLLLQFLEMKALCQHVKDIVLGNLMRLHHPGEVRTSSGERTPTKLWSDYALAFDPIYGNAQGAISNDF